MIGDIPAALIIAALIFGCALLGLRSQSQPVPVPVPKDEQ